MRLLQLFCFVLCYFVFFLFVFQNVIIVIFKTIQNESDFQKFKTHTHTHTHKKQKTKKGYIIFEYPINNILNEHK